MLVVRGESLHGGISIGPVYFLHRNEEDANPLSKLTPHEEYDRFQAAKERAVMELNNLQARFTAHLGSDEAAIFQFQSMILEDGEFLTSIQKQLDRAATAEYAVAMAGKNIMDFFESLDDSYMRARAADMRDLARRLDSILSGKADSRAPHSHAAILVAEVLDPSEAALLDPGKLLGLVSREGVQNSHMAILAQAIGVPALVGIDVDPAWEGRTAILDGEQGTLTIDPDAESLRQAQKRLLQPRDPRHWREFSLPCRTRDGRTVRLCASVDSSWEAADAYAHGACGIGLYRTEFLFLNRTVPPSEEEQLSEYRRTVQAMCGRLVAFRTLDMRGKEGEPYGLRASLARPDLLKQQLRAILRASAHGPTAVIFPSVTSLVDLRRGRQLLNQCRQELDAEGYEYSPPQVGVMIRSPAGIRLVDQLAANSNFLVLDGLSLMHAVTNNTTGGKAHPDYTVLWWMLRRAVQAGHRCRNRVTLCGDVGSFSQAINMLLDLGVDEFSVPAVSLIPLRRFIQKLDKPGAQTLPDENRKLS